MSIAARSVKTAPPTRARQRARRSSTALLGKKSERQLQALVEVVEEAMCDAGITVQRLLDDLPRARRELYDERYGKR